MQLRKDPITRSWVITGDDPEKDRLESKVAPCRFCAGSKDTPQVVGSVPAEAPPGWAARSVVHPAPLYRIEGDPKREGDGIYDRMRTVGAHEVLIENPKHDHQLWNASEDRKSTRLNSSHANISYAVFCLKKKKKQKHKQQ